MTDDTIFDDIESPPPPPPPPTTPVPPSLTPEDMVREALADALAQITSNNVPRMRALAEALTTKAIEAAATGDEKSLESVGRQARLIVEQQRISLNKVGWQAFEKIAIGLTRVAMAGLMA